MRQFHWWISGLDPHSGKRFLIYGDPQESVCRQKALEMLSGIDFKMKRLPTRDPNAAARMWKGERLAVHHDLSDAMRRQGRSKTLKRMLNKRMEGTL